MVQYKTFSSLQKVLQVALTVRRVCTYEQDATVCVCSTTDVLRVEKEPMHTNQQRQQPRRMFKVTVHRRGNTNSISLFFQFVPILFVISTSSMLIMDQRTMQIKYRIPASEIFKFSLSPYFDDIAVFHVRAVSTFDLIF